MSSFVRGLCRPYPGVVSSNVQRLIEPTIIIGSSSASCASKSKVAWKKKLPRPIKTTPYTVAPVGSRKRGEDGFQFHFNPTVAETLLPYIQ